MTKIVLDTDVLVSALLSLRSKSAQIMRLLLEDTLNLAISHDIIDSPLKSPAVKKILQERECFISLNKLRG